MRSLSSWLGLREAADRASRSVSLTRRIASEIGHRVPMRIVDLGAGTGSNVRYLTGSSPVPAILAAGRSRSSASRRSTGPHSRSGLRRDLQMDLGTLDSPAIFSGRHLVTASALLDLVSEVWLRALAGHCRTAGAAALFALTYDGRSRCWPPEPEDDTIRTLMNEHQKRSDKGFGMAAGPDATACAERAFAAVGYHVQCDPSDWILEPDARELQRQLIEGWAAAAREIAPERLPSIGELGEPPARPRRYGTVPDHRRSPGPDCVGEEMKQGSTLKAQLSSVLRLER